MEKEKSMKMKTKSDKLMMVKLNKMLYVLLLTIIAAAMVFCFAGCGSSDQAEDNGEQTASEQDNGDANIAVSGGWEVVADPEAVELPEDVNAAFENFKGNYGDDLIPLAYFGKQIVAGTNYELMCKSKADGVLQTVVLQQELNGNVSGSVINDFNIADYTEGEGAEVGGEPVDGGWEVPEDYTKGEIPEDAKAAFDKAMEEFVGNDLEPMALLGTQVVAGTNYAFLCHSSLVTAEPVNSIQVVIVYADLEGNAQITNINTLDLASFNE